MASCLGLLLNQCTRFCLCINNATSVKSVAALSLSWVSLHIVPHAIIVLREVSPGRCKPYSLSSSSVRSKHSRSWVHDLLPGVGADAPGTSKSERGSKREGVTHVRETGAADGGCTGRACGVGPGGAA